MTVEGGMVMGGDVFLVVRGVLEGFCLVSWVEVRWTGSGVTGVSRVGSGGVKARGTVEQGAVGG